MQLQEFVARYGRDHALSLKKNSLEQIAISSRLLAQHLSRQAELADLNRDTLLAFLAERRQQVAPATVNRDRRHLLALWRHASDLELLPPPPRIPRVKEPAQVPHTFTLAELSRLLTACDAMPDPTWWRAMLLIYYETGCRLTAALSIRIGDVSFADRTIVLRGDAAKTGRTQVLSVTDHCLAAIAAQSVMRAKDERVLPWKKHRRRIFDWFRRWARLADVPLPRFRCFHSIRRTNATMTADKFGLETASRQLGHSSIAVTKRYVDLTRLMVVRVADGLPRLS